MAGSAPKCWASTSTRTALEQFLRGFNAAYNDRRQRVLDGKTPNQVTAERLKAEPKRARDAPRGRAGACDLTKARFIAEQAKEVSQPDNLWIHQWRRRHARGRVSIVRYADDFVMGFESGMDAMRMMVTLQRRLAKFGLALHEDKMRLIEFGRLPAMARQQRGERRPETFAFLGFTHYCGWTRDGRFIVKHKTQSKRLSRKLTALCQDARRSMHQPLVEQHRWYGSVLRGHYGYFGLPHN